MRNLYYASQQSAQNTVLLLKQALSEKKKQQKTVQRTSSPGGLWEEAGELGMGVGKRFSKGKDFQREKIFKVFTFLYLQTLELCCS